MSKLRNRQLRKRGFTRKSDIRACRKFTKGAPKCNILYYVNCFSFYLGYYPEFSIFAKDNPNTKGIKNEK